MGRPIDQAPGRPVVVFAPIPSVENLQIVPQRHMSAAWCYTPFFKAVCSSEAGSVYRVFARRGQQAPSGRPRELDPEAEVDLTCVVAKQEFVASRLSCLG